MRSYKMQYSSINKGILPQSVLIFDVHYLFALALTPIFQWSKFSLSARVQDLWRCLLRLWMEALSTRVWQWVCGAVELPHSRDVECFLTALLKKQSWAGLWAYSVSGTNKRGDSITQSTLDKQSEVATNGGRSCRNLKTKMKERQLPWTSLGPYQDGWVLCQTMTIISGPCCVKSSKSPPSQFFLYLLSPMLLAVDNANKIQPVFVVRWIQSGDMQWHQTRVLSNTKHFPTLINIYIVK